MALLGFLALSALVELSAGIFTASSVQDWFTTLVRPLGAPPGWVFGPVWTTLYAMMAVSAWRVWRTGRPAAYRALRLWGWQLLFNALWSPAFFGVHVLGLALAVIVAMVAAIVMTMRHFGRIDRLAMLLLAPYLAWGLYATYLTAGFFVLNDL